MNLVTLPQLLAASEVKIIQDIAMFAHYGLKLRAERLREMQLRKSVVATIKLLKQ